MHKLKNLWKEIEDSYIGTKKYFFLSPTHYSIYHDSIPIFKKYIMGRTLDLGAGRLGWKFLIEKFSSEYFSADINLANKNLSFIADASSIPINNDAFDTVVFLQVLEHTRNPAQILTEITRVLKKNGTVIISFPHLSYVHGEPQDYFRYTIYGFKSLCPDNLKIETFQESGGFICFVFTPLFIFLNIITHNIPILNKMFFFLFKLFSVLFFHLDRLFGLRKIYPLNYIVILRKK